VEKLKNMEDSELFRYCQDLQVKLSYGDSKDNDAIDLKETRLL
jgi:hypothetical protein